MEEELREAFRDIKQSQKENTAEVKGMVQGVTASLQQHIVESATRWTEVDARARSAHNRLDEHVEAHNVRDERRFQSRLSTVGHWVALALCLIGTIVSIVLALKK